MVSDDTHKTPKKRTGLFGGRAPKKAADHAGSGTAAPGVLPNAERKPVADTPAPEQSAAEKPAATKSAATKSAVEKPVAEKPAVEKPVADTSGTPESTKAAFPPLNPESTTSLLFFAPPPEAVAPQRPGRARAEEPEDDEEGGTSTSRRRSRSRRGRGGASSDGDGSGGGSRDDGGSSRTRPRRQPDQITEPQRIKGSTRLEAKKQRRRDGRDAGRRRAVVTEAEFLARRESVDRVMVVRSKDGRIQIGVLEDEVLVEHYVARSSESSLIGNVYLGKVQNVLPSMEAAFVDIGRGRNAVLYSGEVDWDAAAEAGEKNQPRRIELALKPGDTVLVQVTKDPIGHKGARLTSQVSLPGRYLVYVPNGSMSGISRKLPDTERARLKKILKEVLPENVGVIVRTAA